MRLFSYFLIFTLIVLTSCMKSKKVDLIVHNAIIHTFDDTNSEFEAMAIKDGKIVELGPERQILNKYRSEQTIDARGRHIYPGLTDAHAHLKLAAKSRMGIDLKGIRSFDQIVFKLEQFHAKYPNEPIIARGWSEMDWLDQTLPTNEKLNQLFPNIPVCLFRVDEHSALINEYLVEKSGIATDEYIQGGFVSKMDDKITGFIKDKALDIVRTFIPAPSEDDLMNGLMELQEELFMYGVTTVHDAGFEDGDYAYFKKLVDANKWHLKTFGMLIPSKSNFELAKNGVLEHENLHVGIFKFFMDGSLGAHGAFLKTNYSDHPGNGVLNWKENELREALTLAHKYGYQVAFHAIGDSAVSLALKYTNEFTKDKADHRWRLEHGILIDPKDYDRLLECGIIPSLQPLQALSDAKFLESRLGQERLRHTNAFQNIIKQTGILALGSDFPIESHNIHRTIHAAQFAPNSEQSLDIQTIIKALTIWPSIAVFDEVNAGTLEKGKEATFAIFAKALNQTELFKENFSMQTFIKGKEVYSAE